LLIYQRKLIVQPEITGDLLKLLFVIDGLADASGDDGDREIGTELTKSVFRINEMNRMGMIVDLSHVSKNAVIDVLGGSPEKGWNGSLAPPIFSHSFAYASVRNRRTKWTSPPWSVHSEHWHMLYAHTLVTLRTKFYGLPRSTEH
jgi:Membrane dipeptidase (Peptidase family M19)